VRLRSVLLNIVQDLQPLLHRHRLIGVAPIFCRGASIGRSALAEGPPTSVKVKVKSRKWSCRGHAHFTSKKRARA